MEEKNFLGVDLQQFVTQNKGNSMYYQPIERPGALGQESPAFSTDSTQMEPDFFIAPIQGKIDVLTTSIIEQISRKLSFASLPSRDEIDAYELGELVATYGSEGAPNGELFKQSLQEMGLTAVLREVARKLNETRLSLIDRAILSQPTLAMYTYFRAIVGFNLKDVEGIISNVHSSLVKIKRGLNLELVDVVIDTQYLDANEVDRAFLKEKLGNHKFSYKEGEPAKVIEELYNNRKKGGDLYYKVEEFLASGVVKVPPSANRDVLIEQMVKYLIGAGFAPQPVAPLSQPMGVSLEGNEAEQTAEEGLDASPIQEGSQEEVQEEQVEEVVEEAPKSEYQVEGRIVNSSENPIVGIKVRAWDKDTFGKNDLLGEETLTDEKGYYVIPYTAEDFMDGGRERGGAADIMIHVIDERGRIIARSKVHKDVPKHFMINLKVAELDDFSEKLVGIPKEIEGVLYSKDIRNYRDLTNAQDQLLAAIATASDYDSDLATKMQWKEQAKLANRGRLDELRILQDSLKIQIKNTEESAEETTEMPSADL